MEEMEEEDGMFLGGTEEATLHRQISYSGCAETREGVSLTASDRGWMNACNALHLLPVCTPCMELPSSIRNLKSFRCRSTPDTYSF
jgi:hypothetical protein